MDATLNYHECVFGSGAYQVDYGTRSIDHPCEMAGNAGKLTQLSSQARAHAGSRLVLVILQKRPSSFFTQALEEYVNMY